jgi:hypothetical protein
LRCGPYVFHTLLDKVTQAMAIVETETPWIMEGLDVGRRDSDEKSHGRY